LGFIAENSSLLFVVQSNQLIEHVSSRSGGLGIFPRTQKIPSTYFGSRLKSNKSL